jgi:hypothetical protein
MLPGLFPRVRGGFFSRATKLIQKKRNNKPVFCFFQNDENDKKQVEITLKSLIFNQK